MKPNSSLAGLLGVGLPYILACIYCSGASLWIDEAYTAWFSGAHSWSDLIRQVLQSDGSEVQMPLYLAFSWVFAKMLGTSEWALRFPNIFYAWLALWAMACIGRRQRLPWLPLMLAVSPFFAYYINEARPYTLVMACSAWSLYGAMEWMAGKYRESGALWIWLTSGFLLCAAHMLGVFWLGGMMLVLLIVGVRQRWLPTRRQWVMIGLYGMLLALLGIYFAWTLSRNAGGTRLWKLGVGNVAYALYEMAGGAAFGPPRDVLRACLALPRAEMMLAAKQLAPYGLGVLLLLVAYGWAVIRRLRVKNAEDLSWLTPVAWMVGVAVAGLVGLSIMFKWAFWGRHVAFIFPALLCFFMAWMRPVLQCKQAPWPTRLGWALMLLLLVGGLNQRFNPAYAKDDYRDAAAIARQALADGKTVWWAADTMAAQYYDLKFGKHGTAALLLTNNLSPASTEELAKPGVIIISKTDIYDAQQAMSAYIKNHNCALLQRLPAFTIWGALPPG